MKISVNWLKNYVNIPTDTDFHQFGELFTVRTAEVEEVIDLAKEYDKMVVGNIETIKPHPDADKLQITTTNVGSETLQIVCGARNIFEGQTVAVALPEAWVRWHGEGDPVELKPTKIRGVESFGMICAAEEIGLKSNEDGIMDLSYLKNIKPGTPLAEALGKNDIIIDIENKTLTHRPDLWGHYGIAREVAAITNEKLKPVETHQKYPSSKAPISVEVTAKDLCRRYLAVTIDNIKVEPSPDWLRTALENTGNKSINNIVDATNFVMLELGNPLHAFDTTKIKDTIIVRTAKKGEKLETLNEGERELDDTMLVIADKEKPMALAGIMGGLDSGITENTTSITLEAANFDPVNVRKTSVKTGIRTESLQRFEKNLDPLLAEQAMDRIVKIILDLCPSAQINGQKIDINNYQYKKKSIALNLNKVNSKIGVAIPAQEIQDALEKLEFKVKPGKASLKVDIPSFRATKDIDHQDDLIEEIARMYGYERIPGKLPEISLRPGRPNHERFEKYTIRNIIALEHGFHECLNYSFYSQKTLQNAHLDETQHLKVRNYLSEEQTHLRTTLLPLLLTNARENLKHQDGFRLFEIGRTFHYINEYFPREEKHLAGLIVKPKKDKTESFYEVKSVVEGLLNRLDINSLKFQHAQTELAYAHPNRHATWLDHKSKQEIIHIFDLHPLIAKNFGLQDHRISCFEINYTLLHALPRSDRKYKEIPRFPGIEIDISVLVPKNLEYAEIEKQVRHADQNLINKITLFDLYQGSNIPQDQKSLAFKVTLLSPDRTLTDAEMKAIQQKIFQNLAKIGGQVRGL